MSQLTRLEMNVKEEDVDMVIGLLFQMVSYGWEEESLPTGDTRFRIHSENTELIETICQNVRAKAPEVTMTTSTIANQEWTAAWREFFTPVPCGRFVVIPPWLEHESKLFAPKLPIIIEPRSAFGTGHHNTTVLCLEALSLFADEGLLLPTMNFLDVGTGSGVLGIGCALLGLNGLGVDIDPVAIDNACENAHINNVGQAFAVQAGSMELVQNMVFDVVVANILADPLKSMASQIKACMKPQGRLILSGLLELQADQVEAAYAELGPARRLISGEWAALMW